MPDASATLGRDTTLASDAALLADTVRQAGALGLAMFRTELKMWTKGESSPVSEADIAVNDLIESRLKAATPDYGWLSEESADNESRLGRKLTWIIDPIDGTRGYLAGREDWCVSVALVEDATPLLAAVFAPATDEFFFAVRGQGARCNDRPISRHAGHRHALSPHRRAEAAGAAPCRPRRGHHAVSANRLAGAAPVLGGQRPAGCGLRRRAEPGLGPRGGRFDRARSEW